MPDEPSPAPRPVVPYVRDFEPRYGEAVVLSPRLRRVTAENPGPFTFYGTNSFIAGQAEVVIIDPGPDLDSHFDAMMAAVRDNTVTALLLTHTHRDHWPLTPRLAAALKVPVFARRIAGDAAETADYTIKDGDVWHVGDTTLRAVATPGHACNHVCFEIEEEDTLVCGDHVMAWSTTAITESGRLSDYMDSLSKVLDRKYRRLVPAHGAHVDDPEPLLRALIAHRLYREAEVLNEFRQRRSASLDSVAARLYPGLPEGKSRAARMSVAAHLAKLVDDGLLTQDGDLFRAVS